MLSGFEPLVIASGVPKMTITKNGVAFNKSTVEKLEMPSHVIPMIDRQGHRFAIVGCSQEETNARVFYKGGELSNGVRWNNADLMATLEGMMGWNVKEHGIRIEGVYDSEDKAIIFDLNQVTII